MTFECIYCSAELSTYGSIQQHIRHGHKPEYADLKKKYGNRVKWDEVLQGSSDAPSHPLPTHPHTLISTPTHTPTHSNPPETPVLDEIAAMQTIAEALAPLPPRSIARILLYAQDVYRLWEGPSGKKVKR